MKFINNKKLFLLSTLSLLSFFCLGLSSCGADSVSTAKDGGPLSDSDTLKYRNCTGDTDCIYAQNGCCDCANGGADIAINSSKLTEFRANFSCDNVTCTMLAPVPVCGSGTISCKSGLCEYTKATVSPHTSSE